MKEKIIISFLPTQNEPDTNFVFSQKLFQLKFLVANHLSMLYLLFRICGHSWFSVLSWKRKLFY